MEQKMPIIMSSEIEAFLKTFQKSLQTILEDNLTGIYITGSLAEGIFNPTTSDVDLLVILKNLRLTLRRGMVSLNLNGDMRKLFS